MDYLIAEIYTICNSSTIIPYKLQEFYAWT